MGSCHVGPLTAPKAVHGDRLATVVHRAKVGQCLGAGQCLVSIDPCRIVEVGIANPPPARLSWRMDTNWLEDFLAILDEGGFSRGAEKRGITQPAFSRRIKALEAWIGVALFDRATHAVRLTPAGDRFRTLAEEVLRRLKTGRDEIRAVDRADAEMLRFASTHALSLTFFPRWLRDLEARMPSATAVQLTADNMMACERLMIEGRAQFLLCHSHPAAATRLTSDAFRSVGLGTDVLVPVAAPARSGGGGQPISDAFLAYAAESGMGRILAAAWAKAGRTAPGTPVFSSHLASVLAAMARDGRGVAWSPMSLVEPDLAEGRLVRAGPSSDDVPMEIRLFRSRHRQSPAAEAFWHQVVPC